LIDYALVDRLGIGRQMFFPRPDLSPVPPGAEDFRVEVAPGIGVHARFHSASPSSPTILFFHGNGEVVGDYDDVAETYREIGLGFFVADYRGYGASDGRAGFAAIIEDAHPIAVRFHAVLDERGFTGTRFVMGRSMGSHPALELAARRPERFSGLILESGVGHLSRLVRFFSGRPITAEAQAVFDAHADKVRSIALPALVLHGRADELVPVETAVEFHGMLTTPDKELVIIPGVGHNDIFSRGRDRYFAAIRAFTSAAR
jgi:alpha-beta hydrolase superfamily lysophospholipase